MITEVYNIIEIIDSIKGEIEDDIKKIEFSAVKFDNDYAVGLFINDRYILDDDIFNANTIKEMKLEMKDIYRIIKNEFNIECECTYSVSNTGIQIQNEKIS